MIYPTWYSISHKLVKQQSIVHDSFFFETTYKVSISRQILSCGKVKPWRTRDVHSVLLQQVDDMLIFLEVFSLGWQVCHIGQMILCFTWLWWHLYCVLASQCSVTFCWSRTRQVEQHAPIFWWCTICSARVRTLMRDQPRPLVCEDNRSAAFVDLLLLEIILHWIMTTKKVWALELVRCSWLHCLTHCELVRWKLWMWALMQNPEMWSGVVEWQSRDIVSSLKGTQARANTTLF